MNICEKFYIQFKAFFYQNKVFGNLPICYVFSQNVTGSESQMKAMYVNNIEQKKSIHYMLIKYDDISFIQDYNTK